MKYQVGTKIKWSEEFVGVVIPNFKLPGDICVRWNNGMESSYDADFLEENTEILPADYNISNESN